VKTATTATGPTSTVDTEAAKTLPKRPKGVVAVDGPVQGSLTPRVPVVAGVDVSFTNKDEDASFTDLCTGEIDVLETSRTISAAERRICARNGIDLVAPIQVASDAVVIATRNESDVGGDCLRLSTVNDIFRAGAPITNWSQVGFFDIPLRVTGREATAPSYQFFAQAVLGVDSNATLSDVRSDYVLRPTDNGVRKEVTSEARVARVVRHFRQRIKDLELDRQIALSDTVTVAINRARKGVLDQIDRENKRRADQEITLTATQKLLIARQNLRRINAAIRAAQNRALARFSFPRLTFARERYKRALRGARLSGTIGIFRFSYYELFENLLRPMEIWDPVRAAEALEGMTGVSVDDGTRTTTTTTATTATDTTGTTATTTTPTPAADADVVVNPEVTPWCVFPSQTTITNGSYPLSRPFYLYVSKLNLKRAEVTAFLTAYVNGAQALAARTRLVPIGDTIVERNLRTINGEPEPSSTNPTSTTSTTATTTTATTPPGNLPGVATPSSTTTTP
jgi:hypothetical protein